MGKKEDSSRGDDLIKQIDFNLQSHISNDMQDNFALKKNLSFPRQADRGLSKIISIANNPTSQKKGFEPLVNVNGSPSQNQLSLLFGADEQDNI